jgi:hypothetical protein
MRGAVGVVCEGFREKFDRNTAAQLRVGPLVDVAHTARSDVTGDLVVCELSSHHRMNENSGADSIKLGSVVTLLLGANFIGAANFSDYDGADCRGKT